MFRSRSVAVNTPAYHAGDRGFDSRRDHANPIQEDRHFLRLNISIEDKWTNDKQMIYLFVHFIHNL